MPVENSEIYFVIVFAIILGLLLVGFIVTILFLYKKRQQQQEQELVRIKAQYEKETLRSQLEIQENTFKSIAQELHDNIGQMLSVTKLSLSVLPIEKDHPAYEISQHSQKVLNKAIFDLSDLTKSLHTDRITHVGLAESIRFEMIAIKNTGLVTTEFHLSGTEFPMPDQKAIFLFRMFQEAVNNILKHAQATHIKIDLQYGHDYTFALQIEDNGVGFDVEAKRKSAAPGQGVGLKSIFNRAELIGATLSYDSKPGQGTRVRINLPSQHEYQQ
jgi:signal transduction histidine kinase